MKLRKTPQKLMGAKPITHLDTNGVEVLVEKV
jgi:hypothetical protein